MKHYKITNQYGYSILGEKPPKMDTDVEYVIISNSIFFPNCVILQRADHKYFHGEQTWIVTKSSLY